MRQKVKNSKKNKNGIGTDNRSSYLDVSHSFDVRHVDRRSELPAHEPFALRDHLPSTIAHHLRSGIRLGQRIIHGRFLQRRQHLVHVGFQRGNRDRFRIG
uniref:(northern house mosquito) hypothetical protein n=1 Tax=Culex pipiens TaxID=7175 RepID=A0A8D8CPA8_CULPI